MLSSSGMIPHTPLIAVFLLASPAARGTDCADAATRDAVVQPGAIDALTGRHRELASVRLTGSPVPEDRLWELIGGAPPLPLSRQDAVALVARLAQTGLFASIDPRIAAMPGDEVAALDVQLTPNPRVQSVRLRGLSEFRSEDVLDRLLEAPSAREAERSRKDMGDALAHECPEPLPPRDWLAHGRGDEVRPGILWHGLRPALDRVLRYLRGRGYPLARIEGQLSANGDLALDVDEGRIGSVEVRGVDARLAREVEAELQLRRGDVFSSGELYSALDRIEKRWPFLRPDRRGRVAPPLPQLRVEMRDDGSATFRSEARFESAPPPPDDDDEDDDLPRVVRKLDRKFRQRTAWYGFEGENTLVLHLSAERSTGRTQWMQLLRHTPVTGFAPGLAGTWTLWDPADRAHLMLDGAFNYNTRRPDRPPSGPTYLERLNAKERVDWLVGARLRMPALDIAELGGQVHNLTDTADGWRISPIDSYLYSALINRADREYYKRSGYSAFLTLHLFEELTLGAEYRRDRYANLPAPNRVWSVWNEDEPLYGSMLVDEGEMGSTVFRLEYHSEGVPLHKVGTMWRGPETSLIDGPSRAIGVRSLNTLEVANPSMGGTFDFTKVVSDTFVTLETGRDDTLTLRVRGAGGRDLPLQKQEGLGGWTALRGYDFKEFRGNASLLATLQMEGRHFGAFLDVGSVRQISTGNWIDPKTSAGLLFTFASGSTRAEAAWRLDAKGRLVPDFRLLFQVPL